MHEVVVYGKPDCCLCDEAKSLLRKLAAKYPFAWREVNILGDPETFEKYKNEIPVIFINGKKAFKYRIQEEEFVRRLRRAEKGRKDLRPGAHDET